MIKRAFDIIVSLILMILLSPFVLGVMAYMLWKRDLPFLYTSERMKTVDQAFTLYKFRTMRNPKPGEKNTGVSGGDKSNRITPIGSFLRGKRLDEIPQLINIFRGDMSFVGPRPPLRQYTESHRELYERVLQSKPGVTGLASMIFHKHEERLLQSARTLEETSEIYSRRCIPRKATLDLIYHDNQNLGLDLWILYQTLAKLVSWLPGRRSRKSDFAT